MVKKVEKVPKKLMLQVVPSIQPVVSQAPPSTAGLANISPNFVSVKIKDVEAQVHETVTN